MAFLKLQHRARLLINRLIIAVLFLSLCTPATAKIKESFYQDTFCLGVQEYVLSDRTRVDCLTETHAIEYDFGKKWNEAIGQSLSYSLETGKRAGIVLILKRKKDYRYWIRLNSVIDYYQLPIDTWKIHAWEEPLTLGR